MENDVQALEENLWECNIPLTFHQPEVFAARFEPRIDVVDVRQVEGSMNSGLMIRIRRSNLVGISRNKQRFHDLDELLAFLDEIKRDHHMMIDFDDNVKMLEVSRGLTAVIEHLFPREWEVWVSIRGGGKCWIVCVLDRDTLTINNFLTLKKN